MKNPDILATHIRSGGFLLVEDKAGAWLLGSARNLSAFEQAVDQEVASLAGPFILIAEMSQLYEYVLRFPDLAWDIAEGSEKALLIWYEHPKATSSKLLDEEKNIGIMLNRCKPLQLLLQKLGTGLLCALLPTSEKGWPGIANVLPLPLDAGCRIAPERIMRLGVNGDVKFLKY